MKVTAISNQGPSLPQRYSWPCHKCHICFLRPLLLPRFLSSSQPQMSKFPTLQDFWLQELQQVIQMNPTGRLLPLEPLPTFPPAFMSSSTYHAWNALPPDSYLANSLTPFTSLLTCHLPKEACPDHLISKCTCTPSPLPDLHFFLLYLTPFSKPAIYSCLFIVSACLSLLDYHHCTGRCLSLIY